MAKDRAHGARDWASIALGSPRGSNKFANVLQQKARNEVNFVRSKAASARHVPANVTVQSASDSYNSTESEMRGSSICGSAQEILPYSQLPLAAAQPTPSLKLFAPASSTQKKRMQWYLKFSISCFRPRFTSTTVKGTITPTPNPD